MNQPQSSRCGARASRAWCCASSQAIASAVARPRVCHAKACGAGGRTWYITARPCSEWDRPPASAVAFHGAWTDLNHRGAARARRNRTCCASSQETASAVARPRAFVTRKPAVREAAPGTSHHGLAVNGRGLPLVQWLFMAHKPTTTIAEWRVRFASARAAPPLKRQPAQWRARARLSRESLLCWRPQQTRRTTASHRVGDPPLVQWRYIAHEPTTIIAVRCARVASVVLRLLPSDSQRSGAPTRLSRESLRSGRPHLVHHSTALHRVGEAFRWCSGRP